MSDKTNSPASDLASDDYRYAKLALAWHGWGSPVGLGLFLVALAAVAVLVRRTFLGL